MKCKYVIIFTLIFFHFFGVSQIVQDVFPKTVYLKYESWRIRRVIDVPGYLFCGGVGKNELHIENTTFIHTVDSLVAGLQTVDVNDMETHPGVSKWPDVRRQIIVVYSDETYNTVSYDTHRMEMNGRLVRFNQELFDLMERCISKEER
jgi:hypothetical protein